MNASARLLFLSIGLNVALAAAAFYAYRKPVAPLPVAAAVRLDPVSRSGGESNRLASPKVIHYSTNPFRWSQIESTNYDEFVSRLRAIGCPEKTLRDIVLAEVEKSYYERRRGLRSNQPFWRAGNRRREEGRSWKQQFEMLEKEKEQLLERLLGPEASPSERFAGDRFEEQALVRFLMGPVPEATFQRVVRTMEKYEALRSKIHERTQGILTEEDEAALQQLNTAGKAEFSTLMTPLELEEFAARSGTIKLLDHDSLLEIVVPLSPNEFRQIALASAGTTPFGLFDGSNHESEAEEQRRELEAKARVATLLGPERFADFERAQDGDFREVFKVTQENELPKATAVKIFEIRKLAAEELQQIRNNASLEELARRQLVDDIQKQTQGAVAGLLGGKAYQQYLNRGGAWVTNASSL
jgi:hypothetical protein